MTSKTTTTPRIALRTGTARKKTEAKAARLAQEVARAKAPSSGQAGSEWTVESLTAFLALGGEVACQCGAISVTPGGGVYRYRVRSADKPYTAPEWAALAALGGIHEASCDGVLR